MPRLCLSRSSDRCGWRLLSGWRSRLMEQLLIRTTLQVKIATRVCSPHRRHRRACPGGPMTSRQTVWKTNRVPSQSEGGTGGPRRLCSRRLTGSAHATCFVEALPSTLRSEGNEAPLSPPASFPVIAPPGRARRWRTNARSTNPYLKESINRFFRESPPNAHARSRHFLFAA
jgi:hypothetical protein